MGRFGKQPVLMPDGVTTEFNNTEVTVRGPKGSLTRVLPRLVNLERLDDGSILVSPKGSSKLAKALQGTYKSHLDNMVHGVTEGWSKTLEIVGAGYRAEVKGNELVMAIGYSHPVVVTAPEGISFKVEKSLVTVDGIDKDAVGQTAAIIRSKREPEPYKGSGIKYQDEVVRRKAGKQAAKTA